MRRSLRSNNRVFLALGLALFLPFIVRPDDNLLANGDFSQGSEGWGGDVTDDSDAINNNSMGPSNASGHISVNLDADHASRIYQAFESKTGMLDFSITWSPSPGLQFSDVVKVAKIVDVEEVPVSIRQIGNLMESVSNPNYAAYLSIFRGPVAILEDRDGNQVFPHPLKFDLQGGSQTATFSMVLQTGKEYKLYIAFPPGSGSITLTRVSLTKGNGNHPPGMPMNFMHP